MNPMRFFPLMLFSFIVLFACKKDDDCETVQCQNGGVCENGFCDCPPGYEGQFCEDQDAPLKILVTGVQVTRFPATDAGANWDIFDGPDIFFQLFDGQVLLYQSPDFIEDADPTQDYTFTIAPIEITDVTGEHTIQLMDYDDFDPDDFMGGIVFTPYWDTNGFPSVLALDAGGTVAFSLSLQYVW